MVYFSPLFTLPVAGWRGHPRLSWSIVFGLLNGIFRDGVLVYFIRSHPAAAAILVMSYVMAVKPVTILFSIGVLMYMRYSMGMEKDLEVLFPCPISYAFIRLRQRFSGHKSEKSPWCASQGALHAIGGMGIPAVSTSANK